MSDIRLINKDVLLQEIRRRRLKLDEMAALAPSNVAQTAANRAFDACALKAELGALSAIYDSLE
jgi:hypothetical protein